VLSKAVVIEKKAIAVKKKIVFSAWLSKSKF
jgi:hypothetical protein